MTSQDLFKGALCGLVAGVAATAAKTVWEEYFPVRHGNTDPPPAIIAQQATERTLTAKEKENASLAIHSVFGIGTGLVYGGAAEAAPFITSGLGLPFGLGFYGMTHGSVVPALGLEPWPTEVKREYAANEFAGHLVYALTLELVRRGMREFVVD